MVIIIIIVEHDDDDDGGDDDGEHDDDDGGGDDGGEHDDAGDGGDDDGEHHDDDIYKMMEWLHRRFFTISRSQARDRVVVFKRPKFVYRWFGRVITTPSLGFGPWTLETGSLSPPAWAYTLSRWSPLLNCWFF